MPDYDWYKPHPDRPTAPSQQPRPGEEVWRLRDNEIVRVQTCELRGKLDRRRLGMTNVSHGSTLKILSW